MRYDQPGAFNCGIDAPGYSDSIAGRDQDDLPGSQLIRAADWKGVPTSDRQWELNKLGDQAWKDSGFSGSPQNMHMIFAVFNDGGVFELDVGKPSGGSPVCNKRVHGDHTNTARFLLNHYLPGPRLAGIKSLILLASHAVLMAGRENRAYVSGLQVAVVPHGGPVRFLSRKQEKKLETLSASIHARTAKELLQPFDYH